MESKSLRVAHIVVGGKGKGSGFGGRSPWAPRKPCHVPRAEGGPAMGTPMAEGQAEASGCSMPPTSPPGHPGGDPCLTDAPLFLVSAEVGQYTWTLAPLSRGLSAQATVLQGLRYQILTGVSLIQVFHTQFMFYNIFQKGRHYSMDTSEH